MEQLSLIVLILLLTTTSAIARDNGHTGVKHDSTGHHIGGPTTPSNSSSHHNSSRTSSTHTSHTSDYSASGSATNTHLWIEQTPQNTTPPKVENDYDKFMKAFDRNRFKNPPQTSTTGEIKRDEHGHIERSESAKNEFKRQHPCPSNGKTSGSCPGYVIDHIKALKHGGDDAPSNMQWQTISEGKAKDKWE